MFATYSNRLKKMKKSDQNKEKSALKLKQ
jgi:hypothetical protein